jgi:hypothetical protein
MESGSQQNNHKARQASAMKPLLFTILAIYCSVITLTDTDVDEQDENGGISTQGRHVSIPIRQETFQQNQPNHSLTNPAALFKLVIGTKTGFATFVLFLSSLAGGLIGGVVIQLAGDPQLGLNIILVCGSILAAAIMVYYVSFLAFINQTR